MILLYTFYFLRYAIPPEYGGRFERVANGLFPTDFTMCPAHLRHKMSIISPTMLANHNVPFDKVKDCKYEMLKYSNYLYLFVLDNTRKRRIYNNFSIWIPCWL